MTSSHWAFISETLAGNQRVCAIGRYVSTIVNQYCRYGYRRSATLDTLHPDSSCSKHSLCWSAKDTEPVCLSERWPTRRKFIKLACDFAWKL